MPSEYDEFGDQSYEDYCREQVQAMESKELTAQENAELNADIDAENYEWLVRNLSILLQRMIRAATAGEVPDGLIEQARSFLYRHDLHGKVTR